MPKSSLAGDPSIHLVHRVVLANDIRLHLVEAGEGEPVILLHGFPEFWYSWRQQLSALAQAGFRAIALDLRGYNESERPAGVANYRVRELVADTIGVISDMRGGPPFVVGHDWGGLIAWRLAALHPELVRGLAILNAPHPAAFREELLHNPVQWLRSWYTLLFQVPWVPERLLSLQDYAVLERAWQRQTVNPAAFTADDIAQYKQALSRHGLTAPLSYYRAAIWHPGDLFGSPQHVSVPTLVIWGENDPFLSATLADRVAPWVKHLTVEKLPNASHWIQNDAPQDVNRLLIDFFNFLQPPDHG
jgi:epoxide hydrolase 4